MRFIIISEFQKTFKHHHIGEGIKEVEMAEFNKKVIKENVIGTYSSKEMQQNYKKIGLWEAEKILFNKYFTKKGAKILDVGCGGGRTTIPLVKRGFKVTAFDITPLMVDLTKENLKKSKLKAKVEIGDATNIKYKSNSFDYVLFSFNGIEAIPGKNKRIKALKEIYRVLKPGGIFIFTTNTQKYFQGKKGFRLFLLREYIKFYFSNLFNLNNRYSGVKDFEYGDCFLNLNPPMFMHFSKLKKIKSYLKEIGFKLLFSDFKDNIENKENPNLNKDYFYVCKKL